MKKLIVNAEDFGFNSKVNEGIMASHQYGIVTSANIIVTKEGFQEAVDMAKQNTQLDIGIHLDLDKFFNINHEEGLVATPIHNPYPAEEIRQEIKSQIEKLKNTGINTSHISSHHSAHLHTEVFPIVCSIAQEYNIKIIQFPERYYTSQYEYYKGILNQHNLLTVSHFIRGWFWGNIDEPFEIAELVTHPGYGEIWREYELSVCCNPKLKTYLKNNSIELITFDNYINNHIENKGPEKGEVN